MVDPPLGYLSVWCDGSISEIKIEVQKMLIIEIGGSRIIISEILLLVLREAIFGSSLFVADSFLRFTALPTRIP